MPNPTSGQRVKRTLRSRCLSENPSVRFAGHFVELEQVSGESADCHSSPFLKRRQTLNCVPLGFIFQDSGLDCCPAGPGEPV